MLPLQRLSAKPSAAEDGFDSLPQTLVGGGFRSPEQHATASGSVPWSTARRRFEAEARAKEQQQQQQQQQQRQPPLDVEEKKERKADERQVKDEV